MMNDPDKELIVRQTRTIAALCVIVLVLVLLVFFLSFCKKRTPGVCGVKDRPVVAICGNNDGGPGSKLFKQNCAVCHYPHSNARITGPGLKGMTDRLPKPTEEWFVKYTLNNKKVLKSGDAYARKLRKDYKDIEMTVFEGMLSE